MKNRTEQLRNRLIELREQAEGIFARAEAEGRGMTDAEQAEFNAAFAEFETTEATLNATQTLQDQREAMNTPRGPRSGWTQPGSMSGNRGGAAAGEPLFRNAITGETVLAYRGTAPMRAASRDDAPLGDVLRALLLNDMSGLPGDIRASLTVGSDSGGGYLAPPAMSQMMIDLARANSVVMKAGAITIPMASGELTLARLTGDPTVVWRGETGAVTASKPTFGKFTLRPKTCAAIVPVSLELLEDAANAGSVIEAAMAAAIGVEVDRVILAGTGAGNEPLGILNTTGVNTQASVGTIASWAETSIAVRDILAANYPGEVSGLSWVTHPNVAAAYDQLAEATYFQPIAPTPWARDLRRFYTTNGMRDTSTSPVSYRGIVGDFSELLVGMRTSGVVIDVLDAGSVTDTDSETWNATTQFLRFIRARIRIDSLVMRPGFFSTMTGISA